MNPHYYAVVMAGGAGTRFWPASTRNRPKQLLALGPDSNESMLQAVVRRLMALVAPQRIIVVTGAHLVDALDLQHFGIPQENILAEPVGRNTAPCIAWANAVIGRRDPAAIVAVLSADHIVSHEQAFLQSLQRAMKTAEEKIITTLGIQPTRPETGYGYIEVGAKLNDDAFEAVRFVEKPSLQNAQKMLESKRFLWNGGFFFFPTELMADAIAQYLPELAHGISAIDQGAREGQGAQVVQRVFATLPSVSIDVGIMEKLDKLAVVPSDCGWSDMGSWQTAWEFAAKDSEGNAAPHETILVDCQDNMVADFSSKTNQNKVIALLGVQRLVVVQTDDALLVIARDRCQDVRKVVQQLEHRNKDNKL